MTVSASEHLQLFNDLKDFIEEFSEEAIDEADAAFDDAEAINDGIHFQGSTLRASLRIKSPGQRTTTCVLTHNTEQWEGLCSCRARSGCAHLFLAAEILEANFEALVPMRAGNAAVRTETLESRSATLIEQKLGRKLTREDRSWLGQLDQVFRSLQRNRGKLSGGDLMAAGFLTEPIGSVAYNELCYEGWWTSPPGDPWELWQYIAYDLTRRGIPIPEVFQPMTDFSGVKAQIEKAELRRDTAHWREALSRTAPASPAFRAAPTAGGELDDIRLRLSESGWQLEACRQGKPYKALSKKLFEDLIHRSQGPQPHRPIAQAALLLALRAAGRNYYDGLHSYHPKFRLDEKWVESVWSFPVARDAIVGPLGTPWRIEEAVLSWQAMAHPRDATQLQFVVVDPAGAPVEGALLATSVPEVLWVARGLVYRGPAPLPTLPAPRGILSDSEVLAGLRRNGVRLAESLNVRIRSVPVHARIVCQLESSRGLPDEELLKLRLEAVSAEPAVVREWGGQEWRVVKGSLPPAAGPEDPVVEFDLQTADTAARSLASLKGLSWHSIERCWTRVVTPTFPEEFMEWRRALPREVEVVAPPDLAGLLGAPIRAQYHVDVVKDETTGIDWFDAQVKISVEDTTLTSEEIALLMAARGRFVRLPHRGWRRLEVINEAVAGEKLAQLGLTMGAALGAEGGAAQRFHALQLADEAVRDLLSEKAWLQVRDRAAMLRAIAPPALPAGLKAELRPYQREGFHFLAFLSENRFGGVLADDMGLGKTLQALTWLLWLAEKKPDGRPLRALVVCPKSVVFNWQSEAARFAPALPAAEISSRPGGPAVPADASVIVVNYAQLRLKSEALLTEQWDAVILDEGQNIKNPKSDTARVACALRTEHRLVLTGTPIENRLLDLWSLFAFAMPGLLGNVTAFRRLYDDRNDAAGSRARLYARTRHFLLRRTKGQVARDLPARIEENIVCELEGAQAALYQAELKRARQMVLGVESTGDFNAQRFNILQSLLRLRQICCDPRLVGSMAGDPENESAKLAALFDTVLPLAAEGHKVLIFSQFVAMLEAIAEALRRKEIAYLMLTGQTENRQELVGKFQRDPAIPVFLLSLKAAGAGLNLTAANYVILFDPWWNPAVEAQAIDRTHRIGQTSQVIAYRLVARGTVEEKIRALQKEKSALAAAVVQEESLTQLMDLETLKRVLT